MAFVPLKWLSEHVDVAEGTEAADVARDLVRVGLEEEQIHPAQVRGPLVVGRVLTCDPEKQKNGKIINYCRVDVGVHNDAPGEGKEPSELPSRGIICGAHNFGVGDLVVCSLPGAVLPGDFAISARKTYGHISDGMICSERELGLGQAHDGILVLTEKFSADQIPAPGESVLDLLGLGEEVLEINITPDRGYCFSMRGIAREYALSTGATFTDPGLADNVEGGVAGDSGDGFEVVIADDAPIRGSIGCDRFVTRLIEGVDPHAATPEWMVKRLEAARMRSISLPVDVTNYVMLDLGQPLHAYDADKVAGPLVVRRAKAGERHVTLDGVEHVLDAEDLCIADGPDGQRVLGLAGVMGGAETEISETTTTILLESAHFDPISIARTSRRHKIPSESAKRNERGVDPRLAGVAAQVAANLLVRYGGGKISDRVTDISTVSAPEPVTFAVDAPTRLVGVDYSPERVEELLRAIGCEVERRGDDVVVTPPSWRPDLRTMPDYVEEIARLDGYEKIPSIVPTAPAGRGLSLMSRARRDMANTLAHRGLVEVLSYPFVGDAWDRQGFAASDARRRAVRIANPLAEDQPYLRTSVLDTLLSIAERNQARGNADIAVFEIGRVTDATATVAAAIPGVESRPSADEIAGLAAGTPDQPWHIAGVLTGQASPAGYGASTRTQDWRDALEAAQAAAGCLGLTLEVANAEGASEDRLPFHPGRLAELSLDGTLVGRAGELHPDVAAEYGLARGSAAFELAIDPLVEVAQAAPARQIAPISTYPVVKEDMAFVVDEATTAAELVGIITTAAKGLAESVSLFDVYRGPQIGEDKKSLAFALRLRAADRTLDASEIAAVRKRIVKAVARATGGQLRA
ncbi:phenylalanine--tRNA ligase subunit beta [Nanchangia anserum]|uniref:Phenylalanine--tRNA ligase beta subunit n=1 Tax=Nanchangia anserum TaxID=2692125 RepID=A0A8I0KTT9_9ACTO|nr:phenylalanine--tRNA ligase subunit beta [Nanchangia anserum]MBD3688958.1 phenylalanine--tRNA ligase subunit beta [Nanchangia anserum]